MSSSLSVWSASLEEPDILSGAAIVIEADSGTVLYGKNADTAYPPASIVKLLTALIVAENTQPDEMVIFSYDAVYGVETGTGNWQEGQRFSSGASESEVQDWAKSLN